jgi:RHS repeat-associated protein
VERLNPTGYAQVMDELVNGAVTRTYAYGVQRISEDQQINGTWTPSFYGYDGHGSVRFLTNSAGAVTDSYTYDAFGMPITTSGTTPNDFLYSGEQFDSAVGLYYLRARYFNSATGRFETMDPYEGDVLNPATLHKYVYAGNNPVNADDPSGQDAIVEVAFLYTRPGFSVLAQKRFRFDPEELLQNAQDVWDAGQSTYEHASFASKIAVCDSLSFINAAAVLGGFSNGTKDAATLTLGCFYNALRDLLSTDVGNPLPEFP